MNDSDSVYAASDRSNSDRPNLLADIAWREANLDTLDVWHPSYHRIADKMVDLHAQFYTIMKEYKEHLLTYCPDTEEELLNHVLEEVMALHQERQMNTVCLLWCECTERSKQG